MSDGKSITTNGVHDHSQLKHADWKQGNSGNRIYDFISSVQDALSEGWEYEFNTIWLAVEPLRTERGIVWRDVLGKTTTSAKWVLKTEEIQKLSRSLERAKQTNVDTAVLDGISTIETRVDDKGRMIDSHLQEVRSSIMLQLKRMEESFLRKVNVISGAAAEIHSSQTTHAPTFRHPDMPDHFAPSGSGLPDATARTSPIVEPNTTSAPSLVDDLRHTPKGIGWLIGHAQQRTHDLTGTAQYSNQYFEPIDETMNEMQEVFTTCTREYGLYHEPELKRLLVSLYTDSFSGMAVILTHLRPGKAKLVFRSEKNSEELQRTILKIKKSSQQVIREVTLSTTPSSTFDVQAPDEEGSEAVVVADLLPVSLRCQGPGQALRGAVEARGPELKDTRVEDELFLRNDGFKRIIHHKPVGVCAGMFAINSAAVQLVMNCTASLTTGHAILLKSSYKTPIVSHVPRQVLQRSRFPAWRLPSRQPARYSCRTRASTVPSLRVAWLCYKSPGIIFQDANLDVLMQRLGRGITFNMAKRALWARSFMFAGTSGTCGTRSNHWRSGRSWYLNCQGCAQIQYDRVIGYFENGKAKATLPAGGIQIGDKFGLVGFLHRADRHRLLEDGAGQGKSRNLAIMNLSDDGVQAIIDGYTLTKTVNVKWKIELG
ncbi:hypothetical protein S40285_10503 [Stachybotrys chlorohalonatus IBT 40285]|uniref:Aldehyde dehydrogenase domain-containing protein n=1 Tax=Stachybotrys chlorohalonatus (strain IBT 40285) TaxID=1283841 RepID=A0A084R130_STAC4|nr:hypothetical protein S40285_10503 [Stachybotrys chlorohalonata IBT 40285]